MEFIYSDIAIIGAGASGMMAAISAGTIFYKNNSNCKVVILDHLPRVGKKILATGNGKCNLTNKNLDIDNYHSQNLDFVKTILSQYPYEVVKDIFFSIGLELKSDSCGRVYPRSEQASSVLDLMRAKLESLKVLQLVDFGIKSISKSKGKFKIVSNEKTIISEKIIIATGGKSSPSHGSDGSGYAYLKNFGHSLTPIFPALTQIIVRQSSAVKSLKGMRTQCRISLMADNKCLKTEEGELQFTEYGLSGICIFQLSRMVSEFCLVKKIYGTGYNELKISIDLMPEIKKQDIFRFITDRINSQKDLSVENFFIGMINKKISWEFLKQCKIKATDRSVGNLSIDEIKLISKKLKNWEFTPTGTKSFNNSQVTAGGAKLDQFDPATLESKKERGLYACGEILDADADCGGFNLHWAWSSGNLAGISAANNILSSINKT